MRRKGQLRQTRSKRKEENNKKNRKHRITTTTTRGREMEKGAEAGYGDVDKDGAEANRGHRGERGGVGRHKQDMINQRMLCSLSTANYYSMNIDYIS